MIEIRHYTEENRDKTYIIAKNEEPYSVYINTDMVKADISRYKSEIGAAHNKIDDANIKSIIRYLDKVLKSVDRTSSTLEIGWYSGEDGLPKAYPVQFKSEQLYKFNMCNYIELEKNQQLINISIKELNDIIAYEFINRDLGDTHASIEEVLCQCSMMGNVDSRIITDKIAQYSDNLYELGKSMLIGETTYLNNEKQEIYDYFNTKKFQYKHKKTYYKDVLKYSCKYAMTVVANGILKNALANDTRVKLIDVSDTGITLIIYNGKTIDFEKDIVGDVVLQAFGRKFILNTSITVL